MIDPACASVTAYIEEVMVGKKTFGGLFSVVHWRRVKSKTGLEKGGAALV